MDTIHIEIHPRQGLPPRVIKTYIIVQSNQPKKLKFMLREEFLLPGISG